MPNYPDISFVEIDTEKVTTKLITEYEALTGRTLYPADPVRVFIQWVSAIIVQERVLINEAAKSNVPRYARGDYLDSLCELFAGVHRLEASAATVTMRFHISAPQNTTVIIPAGTRVTADGSVVFQTTENAYIEIGKTQSDAVAKCETAGSVGNGFLANQIKTLVDIFPYYEKCENITRSDGGADEETDGALYQRMRSSLANASTAGAEQSYISYAMASSPQISDVRVSSPTAGAVDICVLCQNGEIPSDEILNTVSAAVNDERVRPLTDRVSVIKPAVHSYDVSITWYISSENVSTATETIAAIEAAVSAYTAWQSAKIGRDINPSYLVQLVMQAGAKRVEVISPAAAKIGKLSVAKAAAVSIVNGGVENE